MICSTEGCTNQARRRGVCTKHGDALPRVAEQHGMTGTPEHVAWQNMKQRCLDSNTLFYKNYGGRGIRICVEWIYSFQAFFDDMGERPTPAHSLDRIDNDGDYEPFNCHWATAIEQRNNRQDSV